MANEPMIPADLADRVGFGVSDAARTLELRKLAKIAGFRYYRMGQPPALASASLRSEAFDTAQDAGGYAMIAAGLTAVKLLVDEFLIAVHWNTTASFAVPPVLSAANFRVETIDPSGEPPEGQIQPEFVLEEPAQDISLQLSTLPDFAGQRFDIEPASRIIRFGLDVTSTTQGVITTTPPLLVMQVSPRLRTPYLLWEMSQDLRTIARNVGLSRRQVTDFLERMSAQAGNFAGRR